MLALTWDDAALARPATPHWFARLGVSRLDLRDKLALSLAGAPVPGAGLNTRPHATASLQVGWMAAPRLALAATFGVPPSIKVQGRGVLAPLGRLASTTYGPTALTAQFHPVERGAVRPYVGAGLSYLIIFSARDGAFRDVRIRDDLAPVLEVGADLMVSERFGLFVDAKKSFLRTVAKGSFGGVPVRGRIKLDPLVLAAGATVRF